MDIKWVFASVVIFLLVGIAGADFVPGFSSAIDMSSSFSGPEVSMVTSSSGRYVSSSPAVPFSIDYSVSLSGKGNAAAWINAKLMEGRVGLIMKDYVDPLTGNLYDTWPWNPDLTITQNDVNFNPVHGFMLSGELSYSEKTTASGIIQHFSKSMSYSSVLIR